MKKNLTFENVSVMPVFLLVLFWHTSIK